MVECYNQDQDEEEVLTYAEFPLLLKEGWLNEVKPGWLIYSFLYIFISMKSKIILNRKSLIVFGSSVRNRATAIEVALWDFIINHPGRNKPLHYFDFFYCGHPSFKRRGKY
jgi:hypothetical protein